MPRNILIPAIAATFILFMSCSNSDEELIPYTRKADIESATISKASELLAADPVIENDTVKFTLKHLPGNFNFAPEFTVSPEAKLEPKSGTEMDFSQPQKYTVVSGDEMNTKTYTVIFQSNEKVAYTYSFENVRKIDQGGLGTDIPPFDQFYEIDKRGQKDSLWASGNDGISILIKSLVDGEVSSQDYPTYQTSDGYEGKAAKLVTKETGPLGAMVGSPMAAGNLYIGDFDLNISSTIKSTEFGKPYKFDNAPVAIKGFFKYKAGEDFKNNSGDSDLSEDTWDAYAILFKKTQEDNYLPGDHNFDDERIVSVARLDSEQSVEADEWTAFEIPFKDVEGWSFDPGADYMYTIVFSASKEGDRFNGAEGSTLTIDEVQLITKAQ